MHTVASVNKANFVKLYNNLVLKWLIVALYVVVVPEQILGSFSSDYEYEIRQAKRMLYAYAILY
jgi:hypothetical protein